MPRSPRPLANELDELLYTIKNGIRFTGDDEDNWELLPFIFAERI